MERPNCECCGESLAFTWSDTHGVGCCVSCGLPYTIYHYGDDNKREDKAPSVAIKAEFLPLAKAYWTEKKRRVFPGCFDMGILGGRDRTYSGATHGDMREFDAWVEAHPELLPPKPETAAA